MIRVHIHDSLLFDGPQIYIAEEDENGLTTHVAQPITLTMAPHTNGIRVPPTIDLGSIRKNLALIDAFRTALEKFQTPKPSEQHIAGTLAATERHLSDLQVLLNLKARP